MDDLLSRDPAGEVPADENIVTKEQPGADTTVLSESADPIPQADPEDQGEAFSSVDYSFPDTGENSDPGEYADERYDEPYYDGEDYSDEYYDDADYADEDYEYEDDYYDDSYPDEYPEGIYAEGDQTVGAVNQDSAAIADGGADPAAGGYENSEAYQGPANHLYDPNGTEDDKPVYGSYYGTRAEEDVKKAGDAQAPSESEPERKGPYTSRYDAYRFTAPEGTAESPKKSVSQRTQGSNSDGGEKKKGFLGRLLSAAVLAVVFGVIAAGVFLGALKITGFAMPQKQEEQEVTQNVPTQIPVLGNSENAVTAGKADTASAAEAELTVPQVVEMCMPSMVSITNTSISQYYDFFGGQNSRENVSAGSGIIVGETETELLIATNNHVITNSSEITVTFIDDEAIAGTVKGTDADNDLAIVAVKLDDISEDTKNAIRVVTIGDSNALAVGESVVAIGNALGYGQSVSRGVISALGREVTVDGMTHQLIQTDASINPGNSGGALLNMRGELIGINEIKYVNTDVEGVGYAIPMATAEPILESLGSKSARSVVDDDQASYIGIMCIDVPGYYVQSGYPAGVYVSEVTKGGPAEKAGVREGDIITAMDGISISSTTQLITYLKYYAAGEEIDFSISRLNEDETAFEKEKITITLGSRKDSGIDDSKEEKNESVPSDNTENGGFDVIPDEKR